jgi:hypothetical protein
MLARWLQIVSCPFPRKKLIIRHLHPGKRLLCCRGVLWYGLRVDHLYHLLCDTGVVPLLCRNLQVHKLSVCVPVLARLGLGYVGCVPSRSPRILVCCKAVVQPRLPRMPLADTSLRSHTPPPIPQGDGLVSIPAHASSAFPPPPPTLLRLPALPVSPRLAPGQVPRGVDPLPRCRAAVLAWLCVAFRTAACVSLGFFISALLSSRRVATVVGYVIALLGNLICFAVAGAWVGIS